jgi:hypothetical protein
LYFSSNENLNPSFKQIQNCRTPGWLDAPVKKRNSVKKKKEEEKGWASTFKVTALPRLKTISSVSASCNKSGVTVDIQ